MSQKRNQQEPKQEDRSGKEDKTLNREDQNRNSSGDVRNTKDDDAGSQRQGNEGLSQREVEQGSKGSLE